MNQKFQTKSLLITLICSLAVVFGAIQAAHALTPSGTIIGNSATATYLDSNNNPYTTTSNIVQTVVAAVCGVSVSPDPATTLSKTGLAAQVVYMPYVIKNIGNSQNTYDLSITNKGGNNNGTTTYGIYLDANQNGQVDPAESTAITQLALSIGASAQVIVAVTLGPASITNEYSNFHLTIAGAAAPTGVPGCTIDGVGSVQTIAEALLTLTKTVDKPNAIPGDTLTYNFSLKNTGTKPAKAIINYNVDTNRAGAGFGTQASGILLSDDIPDGSAYSTGTATCTPNNLSVNPYGYPVYSPDALTITPALAKWYTREADVPGGVAAIKRVGMFMTTSLYPTGTPDNTTSDILAINQTGTFQYQVTVNNPFTQTTPTGIINNIGTIYYNNSLAVAQSTTSNNVQTTIPKSSTANVAVGGLYNPDAPGANSWSYVGTAPNGVWTIAPATTTPTAVKDNLTNSRWQGDTYATNVAAGTWVTFTNRVQNKDTVYSDIINLQVDTGNTTLPAGYIVEFWNASGTAKLIDTSADGLVDVGTVPAGTTLDFQVKVFIPSNASTASTGVAGTVANFVTVKATSVNGPTSTADLSRDNIDGIRAAAVDIAQKGNAGDAIPGNDNYTSTTNAAPYIPTVDPGTTAVYPLQIVNTGVSSDTFALSVTTALPAGTTAKFYTDPNCDGTPGAQITDTGLMGGTYLTADIAGTMILPVASTANFSTTSPNNKVIVGTNGTVLTITAINAGSNTITVSSNVTANANTLVSKSLCVLLEITTQATTPAGTTPFTVQATSATSGASDTMTASLVVNQLCSLTIGPAGSDQVPAGGTTTYAHTVTNTSNVTRYLKINVTNIASLQYLFIADNTGLAGGVDSWRVFALADHVNYANPVPGPGDAILATGATANPGTVYVKLTPGASAKFKINVFAPSGTPANTVESAKVYAYADADGDFTTATSPDQCNANVIDSTTVISGFLQMNKFVKEPTAGGAGDNSVDYSTTPPGCITSGASQHDNVVPGPCDDLIYKIWYKNIGTTNAVNVVITDAIPANTQYIGGSLGKGQDCSNALADYTYAGTYTDATSDDVADTDNATPANVTKVTFRVGTGATAALGGTLAPGDEGCVLFKVRIK